MFNKTTLVLFFIILFSISVNSSEITTNSQSDFNEGTYNNTFYNTTKNDIELNTTYNNGTYLSKVFNAGANSQWNNISWTSNAFGELPSNNIIETSFANGNINMTGNMGLWHLNEAGGSIGDSSGNDQSGTYSGALYSQSGKINTAIGFDGTTDYIDITIAIPSTVTVSTWAKSSAPSSRQDMLWCMNNAGTGGPDLWFSSGNIYLNTWDGFNNPFCAQPANMEDWHHYVTVISPSRTELYVDGALCGTATYRDPTRTSMAISSSNGYDWQGDIDEFAIWNRTLSTEEILAVYKRGILKLNLSVQSCDDAACSGETWTDVNDTSIQTFTDYAIANNTYFQYKFNFETDNINYTPELYNVTLDYDLIPSLDHHYARTYNENNLPRSNFANQSLVRIKTNITNQVVPTITITDSQGTIHVNNQNMVNESNIYAYNYTLNGSQGWYNVTINSKIWPQTFYQSQVWAKNAGALVAFVSKDKFDYKDYPNTTHEFDTGAAWQNFCLQGSLNDLVVHGMSGLDFKKAVVVLNIPKGHTIHAMAAIGKYGRKEDLPEELQKREFPSTRKKISEISFEGKFETEE